jgi:hypothetical protein
MKLHRMMRLYCGGQGVWNSQLGLNFGCTPFQLCDHFKISFLNTLLGFYFIICIMRITTLTFFLVCEHELMYVNGPTDPQNTVNLNKWSQVMTIAMVTTVVSVKFFKLKYHLLQGCGRGFVFPVNGRHVFFLCSWSNHCFPIRVARA